jgi:MEDS: MEthanogen/methylotroph, DcmR Sensory domain
MSSPLVHSVHFYDYDEALIARLHNIIVSSLEGGSSVLIVATEEHRGQLAAAMNECGTEIKELAEQHLQMLDAKEMLAKFMVNGYPNDRRFRQSVGKLIMDASVAAKNERRGLTVFGEMVAISWTKGNKVGALELERLWNDLLHERSFHLHCAYPRWILQDGSDALMIKSICDEHSSVFGHAAHIKNSPAALPNAS